MVCITLCFLAVIFPNHPPDQPRASPGLASVYAGVVWRSGCILWSGRSSPWDAYCCIYGSWGKKTTFSVLSWTVERDLKFLSLCFCCSFSIVFACDCTHCTCHHKVSFSTMIYVMHTIYGVSFVCCETRFVIFTLRIRCMHMSAHFPRYSIHLWDLNYEGTWESKGTYVYYTDFVMDLTLLCLDLMHHIHMLVSSSMFILFQMLKHLLKHQLNKPMYRLQNKNPALKIISLWLKKTEHTYHMNFFY